MYNHYILYCQVLCLNCSTNQKRDHLLGAFGAVRWEEEDVFAYDYGEFINKHPLGSAKELEQMLRHKGLELRKKLQADIKENPDNWDALNRPASLHSASLILAEMLLGIPQHDRDQFHDIGDSHVYMPLAIM